MSERTYIVLKEETVKASWQRDASTYALAVVCLVPGHLLDATSLSVFGWIVLILTISHNVLASTPKPMDAHGAIAHIKKLEGLS